MGLIFVPGAAPPAPDPVEDAARVLEFALRHYPQALRVARLDELTIDMARADPARGKPARALVALPDEQVVNLRGAPELRDLVLVVRVPNALVRRAASGVVTIQEAASAGKR